MLDRAALAGVERILIPSLNLASSLSAIKLAESHPMLFAAVGVHPTEAAVWNRSTREMLPALISESNSRLMNQAQARKIVAVGEIGLDYYWDTAPHELQQMVLKEQLDLASALQLPVVIHFREKGDVEDGDCAQDLMKILEDWVAGLKSRSELLAEAPGVLHSFSGSNETAQQAIRLNFCIGVTGPVTFQNARKRQSTIAQLPLQSMLIETDAPFLSPHPHRGQRNEPAYVELVAGKIAELHSVHTAEVASLTTANAARIFKW